MDRNRLFGGMVCVLVFGSLFMVGCKKTTFVNSRWANKEIVVDGRDIEWRDGGLYYDEKTNTKIGIRNDVQSLYLCLIFKDQDIQNQILQQGFTLWVSRDKKKYKLWGLRYPVGGSAAGDVSKPLGHISGVGPGNPEAPPAGDMAGELDQRKPSGTPPDEGLNEATRVKPDGQRSGFLDSFNEFELLSSEDEPGQALRSDELLAMGIEGGFSQEQSGGLVYEVKIPLQKTEKTPYAAEPSKKGGYLIGFVTEKTESQGMGGGMESGMGGGGRDGRNFSEMGGGMEGGDKDGGGMGRGGMDRGRMDGARTTSYVELWTMIHLASEPGTGN